MALEKQQILDFADKVNAFGWDLLKIIYPKERKNDCIAPYTLYTLMAMLYEGSRNETERELAQLLKLDFSKAELAQYIQELNAFINLNLANLLAINKEIEPLWAFQHLLLTRYGADILPIDHENPDKTVRNINKWVQNKTQNLIGGIIEDLDKDCDLLLASSTYFSALWREQFPEECTREELFFLENGNQVLVPMMNHELGAYYSENEEVEMLGMLYEGPYMMLFFLPKAGIALSQIENNLSNAYADALFSQFKQEEVFVRLPKFEISSEYDWTDSLEEMGLSETLSDKADFSPISSQPLFVNSIKQKAIISVHEAGTDAAAVAYASFSRSASNEAKYLTFNRPFLFHLIHTKSGTLLFTGRVCNPLE